MTRFTICLYLLDERLTTLKFSTNAAFPVDAIQSVLKKHNLDDNYRNIDVGDGIEIDTPLGLYKEFYLVDSGKKLIKVSELEFHLWCRNMLQRDERKMGIQAGFNKMKMGSIQ